MTPHDDEGNWTRETSRYVDGELAPHQAASVEAELAQEPARTGRLDAWRDAMDLWREDTRRTAARLDPHVMADRVLREGPAGVAPRDVRAARAARRYAAAAVVLLGIGVGGAAWLGPIPVRAAPAVRATIDGVEQERMDVAAWRELDLLRPAWQRTNEEGK